MRKWNEYLIRMKTRAYSVLYRLFFGFAYEAADTDGSSSRSRTLPLKTLVIAMLNFLRVLRMRIRLWWACRKAPPF